MTAMYVTASIPNVWFQLWLTIITGIRAGNDNQKLTALSTGTATPKFLLQQPMGYG
jgi:hypothetical protein